ncbi:MAG: Rossmann-fold NAD(P)-binding domain-containing protein [Planctomycetota bacterium]|jgi:alanine dehydrogenase
MQPLTLGVVRRSSLESECRIPLHPDHFGQIPPRLRSSIRFERGYGEPFGLSDETLAGAFGGVADRADLLTGSDVVLLPKPLPRDLHALPEGGILWGWPHCVQQREITQVAIERRLTLIAWESMHLRKADGVRDVHVFERNNEMAGYCAVAHAMQLAGVDGSYGPALAALILSFGSVSRGAMTALRARGVDDILVLTQRPPATVHDRIQGARYGRLVPGDPVEAEDEDGRRRPLAEVLAGMDLIVNGILQDTDRPIMYLRPGEERGLKPGAMIIDVSCDEGMGFPFARATTFEAPVFPAGAASYYAVHHTPSYLWRTASWEISRAILPFLETVMDGPEAWERDETIRRAIEIRDGTVLNPRILSFQRRTAEYPYAALAT